MCKLSESVLYKLANVYRRITVVKNNSKYNIKFTRNELICTLITNFSSVILGHSDLKHRCVVQYQYLDTEKYQWKNTSFFLKLDLNAKPVARAKKKVEVEPNSEEL